MAIVKPVKVRKGSLGGLKAVLDYIKDENKTDNGRLVFGWNCMEDRAFRDMLLTKDAFDKTTGRQYAHFIQSFSVTDRLTPEMAYNIGKEYIAGLKQWHDFQVLMAVHTNEEHLHIHYVVNSVNSKNGSKWQCSKQDLKYFRDQSDTLCRKYNLHVIGERRRGHRSYGEYTAYRKGKSWKAMLAADIAECLQHAKSKIDFLHRLDGCGIDADFGDRNVMFLVREGTYGLARDMKCGDYALRSYGDFSKENIYNHFKVNNGLLGMALNDPMLLQDALLEIGRIMFPDSPTELQDRYLGGIEVADFDRMTREEIEAYLKQRKLEQLRKKAIVEWESQNGNGGLVLATIADTLELIIKDNGEDGIYSDPILELELENEYEL